MSRISAVFFLALLAFLAGCAGKQNQPSEPPVMGSSPLVAENAPSDAVADAVDDDFYDDFEDDFQDDFETDDTQYSDPLEPWNRFWFGFNDFMLLKVIKPVHKGYTKVVPAKLRSGISNFADNLASPIRFVNSLLQGKFGQAGVEFGRFFINTITSLGLADVASREKPRFTYEPETANFGYTLGVWGFPQGPYIIWPVFGPSTIRNSVGRVGDGFMTPQNYALPLAASLGTSTGLAFNEMDGVYQPYEQLTDAAIEPYVAVRNAYLNLLSQQGSMPLREKK